jgi:hypothetical protein
MLPQPYLVAGLDALSRAFTKPVWSWDEFMNGHRGAGMTASYLLLHDRLVEPHSAEPIKDMLDREWTSRPLYAPLPAEAPAPAQLERLLQALDGSFGTARHIGHDVIDPTFALRAFRLLPETITAGRIDGLCTMAQVYTRTDALPAAGEHRFDPAAYSTWVLESFLECIHRSATPGGSGHLLTFGYAVIDLHLLGYAELCRKAEVGHRALVAQLMDKPADPPQQVYAKPAWLQHDPHLAGHWREQPHDTLEQSNGHAPKYAYAFNGLCALAGPGALVSRAREHYFHVYAGRPRPKP